MGSRAGVANGVPGTADVGSMAPLEASGALPSGRGDGPRLASSRDAYERDRRLK